MFLLKKFHWQRPGLLWLYCYHTQGYGIVLCLCHSGYYSLIQMVGGGTCLIHDDDQTVLELVVLAGFCDGVEVEELHQAHVPVLASAYWE